MSCEYCTQTGHRRYLIEQQSIDGTMYAFIDEGKLEIRGIAKTFIFIAGGRTHINFCPHCGSKLGDSDD